MLKPNVAAINELIAEDFQGNKSAFADALGVNRSQISVLINNGGKGAGARFWGGLIKLCDRTGRDFRKYIFLD